VVILHKRRLGCSAEYCRRCEGTAGRHSG
jgi:hypothetical protein